MKAFSIRQPYAFAIVFEYKPVENRDWKPWNAGLRFRGRVLIHAGVKEERESVEFVLDDIAHQTGRASNDIAEEYAANRHLGAIVGAATITDVVTEMDSRWFNGPYGLLMKDARPCEPIPCKGQLGADALRCQVSLAAWICRDASIAASGLRPLPAMERRSTTRS